MPLLFFVYFSLPIVGGVNMKDYKLHNFIVDLILGALTGGLWWIYRVIRVALSIGKE